MRLEKSQPEPFLQPVSIILLLGQVATSHQFDIWEHLNGIHQQTERTLETEVSKKILGRARAVGLPHPGHFIAKWFYSLSMIQQDGAYYNAYDKDIAVVNIFFGGSTVFGEEMS